MIKSIVSVLIETTFVCTICEMIIPDGSMKKYFRLVMGFVIMCVLVKPLANLKNTEIGKIEFDFAMSEEEMRAESEAYILRLHKDNIEKRVKEITNENCSVFADIDTEGYVLSVTVKGDGITQSMISLIKNETGCDDIRIVSGDKDEN